MLGVRNIRLFFLLRAPGVSFLPHRSGSDLRVGAEFDVPVSEIEEVFPTVVLLESQVDLHEGPPLRSLGFADEMHPRFQRRAVRLPGVTRDAGANNVFPGCRPTAIAWDDVVKV